MVDKFIEGNSSTNTGSFESALGGNYNPSDYHDWDASELEPIEVVRKSYKLIFHRSLMMRP
jgi:hypothetical protein